MSLAGGCSSRGYPDPIQGERHLVLETPSAAENISLYYTAEPLRITKMIGVVVGQSSAPSATWSVRHDTSRVAIGTEVITGGTTTTDTSPGHTMFGFVGNSKLTEDDFDAERVEAGSYIWVTTSAVSGDPSSLSVIIFFDEE